MGGYTQPDYGQLAKVGVLLGVGMLVVGAGGEWIVHAGFVNLPDWENALFFDMEVLGVLLFFLSPFVFGILLPLTEG